MDSLKAELNTALQCDREAEDEVKKLKVRGNSSETRSLGGADKMTASTLLNLTKYFQDY